MGVRLQLHTFTDFFCIKFLNDIISAFLEEKKTFLFSIRSQAPQAISLFIVSLFFSLKLMTKSILNKKISFLTLQPC